ncbi:MAG: Gfo/Idh/MocA family oxidoreductase, partial [Candidatus Brocadiia bacterium]
MKGNLFTRRKFMKKTAINAAGLIAFPYFVRSSALGKSGSVAAGSRITIGMIGVGDHGTMVNLRNFLAQPDARVVAVCDVDPQRRDRARKMVNENYQNQDCAAYSDFREILARSDIDAVMISTPDHWHVPISLAAARSGKDICCEKPTLTINEGKVLCKTIRQYERVFQMSTED